MQTSAIKCALYARYSSDNQREASIEDQIRKCREFAQSKGWVILEEHIYADKAISGSSIAPRLSFNKLLNIARIRPTPFEYILVDDTSRVARNTREALEVFETLSFQNIFVYYVSQGIDTRDETASEMITVHGMVDSLYIRELAKKTHRGIEGQFLKGYSTGAKHYGYNSKPIWSGKNDRYGTPEALGYKLEICPHEAETVRTIFDWYGNKRYSVKKIVNILNAQLKESGDPRPPRGPHWSVSLIRGSRRHCRGLLNNELYTGTQTWNKTTSRKNPKTGGKKTVLNPSNKWLTINKQELRIVSESLWNIVKKRQEQVSPHSQSRVMSGKALCSEHLLTKIAKCKCGATFGVINGGKYANYGCTANWRKGDSVCNNDKKYAKRYLEDLIITVLAQRFLTEPIECIFQQVHANLDTYFNCQESALSPEEINKELSAVEFELENIRQAIKMGIFTPLTRDLLVEAETKKTELSNKKYVAELQIKLDIANIIGPNDIEEYFCLLAKQLLEPASAAETLLKTVSHIHINKQSDQVIDIDIIEKTDDATEHFINLLSKMDTRIRLQTCPGLQPYTSRVFKLRIVDSVKSIPTDNDDVIDIVVA